jgi:hypothetical protein
MRTVARGILLLSFIKDDKCKANISRGRLICTDIPIDVHINFCIDIA